MNDETLVINYYLKNNDLNMAYNELISLLKTKETDFKYNDVVNIIDKYFILFNDSNKKIELLNYKINSLLKIEEYNKLLDTLDLKESLISDDESEITKIYFYKSICFEALDEINLSIEYLNKINDNIRAHALVNKYLKLAILFLKIDDYDKAKSSYDYANQIDFNHSNEMFPLVESDLYYQSNDYIEALNSFQLFFLKSTNKYKYLDRYILINIKLNRLDEAYNFYLSNKEESFKKLSRTNKYNFLKAVLVLLKTLNKEDELSFIYKELENIKPIYNKKESINKGEFIQNILKLVNTPITIYDKYKNIVYKFLKELKWLNIKFLEYVSIDNDGYTIYPYKDKEFKGKMLPYSLLKDNSLLEIFDIKENKTLDYFYDHKLERVDEKVNIYYLSTGYNQYGYLVFSDINNSFYYELIASSLLILLSKLDLMIKYQNDKLGLFQLFDNQKIGLIKIEKENVEFLNKMSKTIFETKDTIITYSLFSSLMVNRIDIIEFMNKSNSIIDFRINDKIKNVEFYVSNINDTTYAYFKDLTSIKEDMDYKKQYYYLDNTPFYNVNKLKEVINNSNSSCSILGLYINIIETKDVLSTRDDKLSSLYSYLKQSSPSSDFYYLGDNHFLLYSATTDKRALESIFNKISSGIKQLYRHSYSLREDKVKGFVTKAIKNKSYKEVEDIISYGFLSIENKDGLLSLDNLEKKKYALYKTYENEIVRIIKENKIDLEYIPIIKEKDNTIRYLYVKVKMPFEDISLDLFNKAIVDNDLESRLDNIVVEKAFNEIKDFNESIRLVIPISKESIVRENFIKKTSVLFKNSFLFNRVIFHISNNNSLEYNKGLKSLYQSGIRFSINFNELENDYNLDKYNLLFMDYKEQNIIIESIIDKVVLNLKKEVVLVDSLSNDNSLSIRSSFRVYSYEDLKNMFSEVKHEK